METVSATVNTLLNQHKGASENFAIIADDNNIDNIHDTIDSAVLVTTTNTIVGEREAFKAETFSDSLFAKLLGVGHTFSNSDNSGLIQAGPKGLHHQHSHQTREPMMLLEAESIMKLEVLLTSILVILSILSVLIILLTLMLSRQWRRARTKCKLHSPSLPQPPPSHMQLAGGRLHPHHSSAPLPPPPLSGVGGVGSRYPGGQVVDMSSCQVHGASGANHYNTNIWSVAANLRSEQSSRSDTNRPVYATAAPRSLYAGGLTYPSQNLVRSVSAYHHYNMDGGQKSANRPMSYHAPPFANSSAGHPSLLLTPFDLEERLMATPSPHNVANNSFELAEPIYQEINDTVIKTKQAAKAAYPNADRDGSKVKTDAATNESSNPAQSADGVNGSSTALSKPTNGGVVYGMITAKQAAKFIPCTQTIIVRD